MMDDKFIEIKDQFKGDIFRDACQLIPSGWHYPEITRCRVCFDGVEYVSEGFKETPWMQTRNIEIDRVVRGCLDV